MLCSCSASLPGSRSLSGLATDPHVLTARPISRGRANSSPEWENRELLRSGPVTKQRLSALQERDLVIAAGRGNRDASRKLVEAFLPAIGDLARDFKNHRVERLELLQEGVAGPARRCAAIRQHADYTLLGLRLVLGPQGDAGARRRTDAAGSTLGSRRPRARADQESPQRTPPDRTPRSPAPTSSAV